MKKQKSIAIAALSLTVVFAAGCAGGPMTAREKGAGIGALIGAGIGAAVYGTAVAAGSSDWNVVPPAAIVLGGAALFGGVGALIGLGVGRTKIVPIYESPKP